MGAATRQIFRLALLALLAASQLEASEQPQIAHVDLAAPELTPETVAEEADFPFLPRIDGTSLIKTARIDEPLEVKPASAETDAMLAGASFVQKSYTAPLNVWDLAFVALYRNALVRHGWRVLDEPPPTAAENEPHVINLSAHYTGNGRDLYARVSRTPDGSYQISVADVGAEDWGEMLHRECHIPIYSVHFKRDLSLSYEDSQPSLEKLAGLLRSEPNLRVEVQGHTDNSGDERELTAQSARRARLVHFALEKLGVPAEHMAVRGYGKSRPVAPNDTDWGRRKNRRIEIAKQKCEGHRIVESSKVES